jgi:hypothetical protein
VTQIERTFVPATEVDRLINEAGYVVMGITGGQSPMTIEQAEARAADMAKAGWKCVGVFRLCRLIGDIEPRR